jgi:hypothetical protein
LKSVTDQLHWALNQLTESFQTKKRLPKTYFMRQELPTTTKKTIAKTSNPSLTATANKPVLADSLEVMGIFYKERIAAYMQMLDELNILQDAPEIEFLCREIIEARTILSGIELKKNYSA